MADDYGIKKKENDDTLGKLIKLTGTAYTVAKHSKEIKDNIQTVGKIGVDVEMLLWVLAFGFGGGLIGYLLYKRKQRFFT